MSTGGHLVTYFAAQAAAEQNVSKTPAENSVGDQEGVFIKSDTGETVFGVGTNQPYSRISMGDNSSLESYNIPALAFNEKSTGNFASGISFSSDGVGISRMCFNILSDKIETTFANVNNTIEEDTNLDKLDFKEGGFNLSEANHAGLPLMIMQATPPTGNSFPIKQPNGNTIQMKQGNNIYINCWPEQTGLSFGTTDPDELQGLTLNGSLNLTNRINFVSTSLVERDSIDNNAFIQNNNGQILIENDLLPTNTVGTEKSLYHVTNRGKRYHELLTRAGLNRVVDVSSSLISVFPNCYTNGYTVTNSGVTTS